MANKYNSFRAKNMKFRNAKQSSEIKTRLGNFKTKPRIADARQKIVQKKRKNVVDARDILATMAKKEDARNKLLKIRQKHRGENVLNSNVRAIGSNILKKTDRNGKISLVTNKTKVSNDLNLAIQHQLGLIATPRMSTSRLSTKKVVKRSIPSPKSPILPFIPPVIRKTILNDYTPSLEPMPASYQFEQPSIYRWYRPGHSDIEPRRHMKSRGLIANSSSGEWRAFNSANNRPTAYIDLDAVDEDDEMPLVPQPRQSIPRGSIHSRLDSAPSQPQTHGILSGTKTKVVVPAGHRIVVSNLQNGVTEDDIRELFEDIGQLLVARLVRAGTAEVIYKNLRDAQKAVDTYHNRQLDGQPMKCLLVNKRPLNNPTAPAIPASEGILSASRKTVAPSNKLVPDLSTIHKVLFQRN